MQVNLGFVLNLFWDIAKCSPQLNTEAGQIKYLGEATLGGQCHVPYMAGIYQGGYFLLIRVTFF